MPGHSVPQPIAIGRTYDCSHHRGAVTMNERSQQGAIVTGDANLPPSRFGAGYTVGGSPGQPPAVPSAGAQVAAVAETINPLAVSAFVLVLLLGPFVVPATIPMAVAARGRSRRSAGAGTGLANAALILSGIYAVLAVVLVTLLFVVPDPIA
jgi:hypothetical protein